MNKQENKRQRIYDLLNAETIREIFVYHIQSKDNFFFSENEFFKG